MIYIYIFRIGHINIAILFERCYSISEKMNTLDKYTLDPNSMHELFVNIVTLTLNKWCHSHRVIDI